MLDPEARRAICRKNASGERDKSPVFVGGDAMSNLANGIVVFGVHDYEAALRRIKRFPRDREARARKRECELFFSSQWCGILTDVDMQEVARRIRQTILGK